MKTAVLVLVGSTATAIGCGASVPARAPAATAPVAYPLLDARCDDDAALAQQRHPLPAGGELFVFQDRDYVWLCATVSDGHIGMLDLRIAAPGLAEPMNLHVSAQLGEWPAGRPDATPTGPSSEVWWHHSGWAALPVRFHGISDDGKMIRVASPGIELVLDKRRFHRGEWKLQLQIHESPVIGGTSETRRFPAAGDLALTAW